MTTPPPQTERRKRKPTVPLWVGTPQQVRWLGWIVKSVLAMNVLDAFMTLVWIYSGRAVEANLLIRDVAHNHPELFVLAKLLVVAFGSFLLWRLRRSPAAVVGIFLAFIAYYWLVIYHLRALDLQLFRRGWEWLFA